jgi:predicted nuclease of predicted toxin-antitoxin system
VKVLLDECIDWRLSRDITGHEVNTARQMGWATPDNRELVALASEHFDVFVTVDRNLSFQRNLTSLPIAVVVLRAKANRRADLNPLSQSFWQQLNWRNRASPDRRRVIAQQRHAGSADPCVVARTAQHGNWRP